MPIQLYILNYGKIKINNSGQLLSVLLLNLVT